MTAHEPRCIDHAVDALKRLAPADPTLWSDLSAAYYVRAQQQDNRASDLLNALAAAERAVAVKPVTREAHFNLALAQEACGLYDEALASWREAASWNDDWSNEAREHVKRLEQQAARDPLREWADNLARLPGALRSGDEATAARLIARYPRKAFEYFDDRYLSEGDPASIAIYARVLSKRLGGDRFPLDVAATAAHNREGLIAFRNEQWATAARSLRSGGSPLYLEAEQRLAGQLALSAPQRQAESLRGAETEARKRGYRYAAARLRAMRGYVLFCESRYGESIADDQAAIAIYQEFGDAHSIASLHRTDSGTFGVMGDHERAWREALLAVRYFPQIADLRIRHLVYGEAANAALALGNTSAARQLQDAAIRRLQNEAMFADPKNPAAFAANLSSSYRGRARIEMEGRDYAGARRDLAEAIRLAPTGSDAQNRIVRNALLKELDARLLAPFNIASAVAAYTDALQSIPPGELRTLRASLLAQRATANRRLGRAAESENDLIAALTELGEEETSLLSTRSRGDDPNRDWIGYFSRFNDVYQQAIALYFDSGRQRQAFTYSERAHAFEPLDLIRKLETVPPDFRKLVEHGPMQLADIQQLLDPGVYLLQYCVTPERTYTWIVSRTGVGFVTQNIQGDAVKRWSDHLREAAGGAGRLPDATAFANGLDAPYEQLIKEPLAKARAMNGGASPSRLVIVPDGYMHGLPFAALHDPHTQRFLIQETPIEISPSATLYAFSVMQDRRIAAAGGLPSALLVGDPDLDAEQSLTYGLEQLRFAREEVAEIRPLYEPRVEVLTGKQATVPAVLRLAQNRSVIHIGAHSVVNPNDPSRSLLFLTSTKEHPGPLEAQELLTQLKLGSTRLVVLAACSSAGGLPLGPEGVAPLVRPLLVAGVPAVVGTLWDVNDATAKQLSVSFHRHYEQGSDAATALQAAQLELLGKGNHKYRAVLWAPFQVIGHASSPFVSTQIRVDQGAHNVHRKDPLQRDDGVHPQ